MVTVTSRQTRCDYNKGACGQPDCVSYVVTRGGQKFEFDLCPEHAPLIDALIESAARPKLRSRFDPAFYEQFIRVPATAFWQQERA